MDPLRIILLDSSGCPGHRELKGGKVVVGTKEGFALLFSSSRNESRYDHELIPLIIGI